MKRSKAFSLIEMLMTMTMGSSLMLLAIGLVHQSLSLSKLGKARSEHDNSLNRLAQQFRSDAHSASAVLAASAESLQLSMPDSTTVTYRAEESSVRREQTALEGPQSHERFQFEPLCNIQFRVPADSSLAQFQLERNFKNHEFPVRIDLQVIAQVGRWQKLEQPPPAEPPPPAEQPPPGEQSALGEQP